MYLLQNIYYRRTRRLDIPLINDIRLLPKGEEPSSTDGWTKVSVSLRSGQFGTEPLFLWYHTGPPSSLLTAEQKANLITEIDVLYGDDIPWYGFEKLGPATLVGKPGYTLDTWITMRRGVKRKQVTVFYIPPNIHPQSLREHHHFISHTLVTSKFYKWPTCTTLSVKALVAMFLYPMRDVIAVQIT